MNRASESRDATRPLAWGATVVSALGLAGAGLLTMVLAAGALGHTERTEFLVYATAFAVLLPMSVWAGRHVAAALTVRWGPSGAATLACLGAVGVPVVLLVARSLPRLGIPPGGESRAAVAAMLVAWGAGTAVCALRLPACPHRVLAGALPRLALATCGIAALAFTHLGARAVAVAVVLAVVLTCGHILAGRLQIPVLPLALVDAAVLVAIVLLCVDVTHYLRLLPFDPHSPSLLHPEQVSTDFGALQHEHHNNFYLAPVNAVLHGRPMLVETFSQYGVGVIYFLTAFFSVAPLGYGPLGLLTGALLAAELVLGYGILRVAGCGRWLAGSALGAVVLMLMAGGFVAGFPSAGGLRFGLAYALILTMVLAEAFPKRRRAAKAVSIAVVATSSVWSVETFAYTGSAYLGALAVSASWASSRVGNLLKRLAETAGACAVAHMLLALLTWALAGAWPDWRPYLGFLSTYTVDGISQTLVDEWSPGPPLASLFLASAIGLATRPPKLPRSSQERARLVGIGALSAFGAVSFTYFLGRSESLGLRVIAIPAFLLVCLWLTEVASRRGDKLGVPGWAGAVLAFWIAGLVMAPAAKVLPGAWPRTALAHLLPWAPEEPTGDGELARLWRSPVIDPRAESARRLLKRHAPGEGPVVVLTEPDLGVETLLRARRANRLPFTHPIQDDYRRQHFLPRVLAEVRGLKSGTKVLYQTRLGRYPPEQRVGIQVETQRAMLRRFRIELVEASPDGLAIGRLVPR